MSNKICVFTSAHLADDIRVYKKQIVSLLKMGYEVYYVTNNSNSNIKSEYVKKNECIEHPKLSIFFNQEFNEDKRWARLFNSILFFNRLPKNCDIYHFHDPDLLFTGFILKLFGKKVIYDAHENYKDSIKDKKYIPFYLRKLISFFFGFIEDLFVHSYDLVICATPVIEQRYRKNKIRHTVVINNYPFRDEFNAASYKSLNKDDLVIYAGGITQQRGMDYLINAMVKVNLIKPCRLIMAGQIYPTAYEELLRSYEGWKFVDYKGILTRDELSVELNRAKAGIVTLLPTKNHVNSQPIKMYEYMSASLPVIGSNFPLWKEIIEKRNCGICVDPQKEEEIAEAIISIISNDNLAEKMGKNGYDAVISKYNWESEEKSLFKAYDGLLKK